MVNKYGSALVDKVLHGGLAIFSTVSFCRLALSYYLRERFMLGFVSVKSLAVVAVYLDTAFEHAVPKSGFIAKGSYITYVALSELDKCSVTDQQQLYCCVAVARALQHFTQSHPKPRQLRILSGSAHVVMAQLPCRLMCVTCARHCKSYMVLHDSAMM